MTIEEKINIFRKTTIFSELPKMILEELAKVSIVQNFKPGDILMKQGEEGHCMLVLSEGWVQVFDGELKLADLEPVNIIGELSLLSSEPRSATVVAATDIVVLQLEKDAFDLVLEDNYELSRTINLILINRMKNQNKYMANEMKSKETYYKKIIREKDILITELKISLQNT